MRTYVLYTSSVDTSSVDTRAFPRAIIQFHSGDEPQVFAREAIVNDCASSHARTHARRSVQIVTTHEGTVNAFLHTGGQVKSATLIALEDIQDPREHRALFHYSVKEYLDEQCFMAYRNAMTCNAQ